MIYISKPLQCNALIETWLSIAELEMFFGWVNSESTLYFIIFDIYLLIIIRKDCNSFQIIFTQINWSVLSIKTALIAVSINGFYANIDFKRSFLMWCHINLNIPSFTRKPFAKSYILNYAVDTCATETLPMLFSTMKTSTMTMAMVTL